MAASHPPQNPSLIEELFTQGYRFDFYQAVRLLEQFSPHATPVGDTPHAEREPVRFQGVVKQNFPASDVETVQSPTEPGEPPVLRANFMGLAGVHGPLPPPYTELVIERAWRGDTALRDFLDIFNHRLISLLYRARRRQRIGLESQSPWQGRFARYLYSFTGLGTPGLQDRLQIEDHPLLLYAGLFVHQSRSLSVLENLLQDFFSVKAVCEPWIGQWLALPEEEYTRIGVNWQNQILGQTALLGTRVWEQQSKFRIHLGPMGLTQFLNFLPIGWGFIPLCQLTRFFVGHELDFEISLTLKAAEIPTTVLQKGSPPRLGWTSWLTTHSVQQDSCVKLSLRAFEEKQRSYAQTSPLLSSLPSDELAALLHEANHQYLPINTVVVRQSDQGNSLFMIESGSVRVVYQEADGTQRVLATLKQGDFFGEISFLSNKPRSATVVTISACKLIEFTKQHFTKIIHKYPRVEQVLQTFYHRRMRKT